VLLSALVGAWALRLSFNFARKLGYCVGEEDYRWAELQRLLKRRVGDAALFSFLWQTFNVLFIAAYQNALLMAITLPCLASLEPNTLPLGRLDALAALLFMLSFALETIADEQQWAFQSAKHGQDERSAAARRSSAVAADCRRGFLTRGCFSWSRHPNFFAEQMIWWSVALFGCAARGAAVRATDVAGAALLSLLFQGSTTFTEQISAAKYPAYAEYQRRVSRLLPLPPRLSRK
jgi:steroid 5-alpha reductase family enzyme